MASPSDDARAVFVCDSCRLRKKACDKKLPTCSHCARRGLNCQYNNHVLSIPKGPLKIDRSSTGHEDRRSDASFSSAPATAAADSPSQISTAASPLSVDDLRGQVNAHVTRVLPSTARFTDDLGAQFFRGPHVWLPFISRDAFYSGFIDYGQSAAPDFGLLVLAMCLLTRTRHDGRGAIHPNQDAVYMAAKTYLIQIQALMNPTKDLICAGILLSLFEYAVQRNSVALATLSMTARLAYSIHLHHVQLPLHDPEFKRSNNIWWAIVICERVLVCETQPFAQGLITSWPTNDRPLPCELRLPPSLGSQQGHWVGESSPSPANLDGFGRAAQAASLLDRLLAKVGGQYPSGQLSQLNHLDADLQSFLSVVLQQCRGTWGTFCGAIAMAIRTMFLLHNHLSADPQSLSGVGGSAHAARAALDTAAQIMTDIAQTHGLSADASNVDALHPICIYAMQSAVVHIDLSQQQSSAALRTFLGLLVDRWRSKS